MEHPDHQPCMPSIGRKAWGWLTHEDIDWLDFQVYQLNAHTIRVLVSELQVEPFSLQTDSIRVACIGLDGRCPAEGVSEAQKDYEGKTTITVKCRLKRRHIDFGQIQETWLPAIWFEFALCQNHFAFLWLSCLIKSQYSKHRALQVKYACTPVPCCCTVDEFDLSQLPHS